MIECVFLARYSLRIVPTIIVKCFRNLDVATGKATSAESIAVVPAHIFNFNLLPPIFIFAGKTNLLIFLFLIKPFHYCFTFVAFLPYEPRIGNGTATACYHSRKFAILGT